VCPIERKRLLKSHVSRPSHKIRTFNRGHAVDEETWVRGSTVLAIGAVLLSLGGAVSLARWWWRRRRPAVESRTRTYAEWPLLLQGFLAVMYGSLWLLRAPDEVFWIARSVIEPCVLVASVVLFVRLLIVLAGRAIRLVLRQAE